MHNILDDDDDVVVVVDADDIERTEHKKIVELWRLQQTSFQLPMNNHSFVCPPIHTCAHTHMTLRIFYAVYGATCGRSFNRKGILIEFNVFIAKINCRLPTSNENMSKATWSQQQCLALTRTVSLFIALNRWSVLFFFLSSVPQMNVCFFSMFSFEFVYWKCVTNTQMPITPLSIAIKCKREMCEWRWRWQRW